MPEFPLVTRQFLLALAVVLLSLLLARLFAPGQDTGAMLLMLELSAAVLISAVASIFVRSWLNLTLLWTLGAAALLVAGLFLLEGLDPGALQRLGPGGMVFLVPVLLWFFGFMLAGLIRLLLHALRRPSRSPTPSSKDLP